MGKGSSAPSKQTAIRDIPAEAKPYLYGSGDKYLTDIDGEIKLDPETGEKMLNPDYVQGVLPAAQELFTMTPEQRTEAGMDYEVAGFSPMQQQAYSMAQSGIGAYKPYLDRGSRALGQGISTVQDAIGGTRRLAGQISGEVDQGQAGILGAARRGEAAGRRAAMESRMATSAAMPFQQEGLGAIRRGQEFLGGAAQGYDPRMAGAYYNPFEQQAVGAAMSDIARAGERQLSDIERQTGEQARQSGAFSGSRRFLEQYRREAPVREEILRRQANTAAQMRQAGYGQAQQQAQNAFEQQQRRQMGVGQLFGQLGTQTGALGTSFGQLGLAGAGQAGQLGMQGAGMGMQGAGQAAQLGMQGITTGLGAQQQMAGMGQGLGTLGMQSAQMGSMAQQMAQSDINLLSQLGAQQQRQSQAEIDASRANAMAPYQQIGFMSDIIQGAPIGTSQTTFSPGASPFQQATGAAITMGGLQRAGIFG